MATNATDLATAEGIKQVIDNLAAREDAIIFAGVTTVQEINTGWYGPLSDFEKIVITYRDNPHSTWQILRFEVAASNGAYATADDITAIIYEEPGGFRVNVRGLTSNKPVLRIVGVRSGGAALADLLAALGVVA